MNAQSLFNQYRNQYDGMTPGQKSAFKGNVTWLSKRTAGNDEDSIRLLQEIADGIGFNLARQDTWRTVVSPTFKLMMVRDSKVAATSHSIISPADASYLLQEYLKDLPQEILAVAMMDTRNNVIGIITVAMGTLNSCHITMREIFKPALLMNAAAIVIAHNHPSGDPSPSPEDVRLTRSVVEAGKLLDVEVLDHIIVGENRFASLHTLGLGF